MKMFKRESVYRRLLEVPPGKVTTYKELATACKTHPRAVAVFMKHNSEPEKIPCYKVVRSDGSLGGYSAPGGTMEKARKLRKDGIDVKNGKIDIEKHIHRF